MIILDGPMGTELDARGGDTSLPLWSARPLREQPELVAAIHRDFASAGARVHTTNTFRTQPRWLGEDFAPLARRAVELARAAVPPGHRVAGGIAPLEDCYRPDLSPASQDPRGAEAEHRRLARELVDAGVDLLLCETFPHPAEAVAAVRAGVSVSAETWIALTAGPEADLMTPREMAAAARACVAEGAAAVLVNCTPAADTLRFLRAIAEADLGVPIGAYANAGAADSVVGWRSESTPSTDAYLEHARSWIAAGAALVGSCCGTTPAHVRALSGAFATREV